MTASGSVPALAGTGSPKAQIPEKVEMTEESPLEESQQSPEGNDVPPKTPLSDDPEQGLAGILLVDAAAIEHELNELSSLKFASCPLSEATIPCWDTEAQLTENP